MVVPLCELFKRSSSRLFLFFSKGAFRCIVDGKEIQLMSQPISKMCLQWEELLSTSVCSLQAAFSARLLLVVLVPVYIHCSVRVLQPVLSLCLWKLGI